MKLADRYEEQKYQDQYSVSNVYYSFLAETRFLFCQSKNIKWWVVSNQEGNCSVGCFPSRVWREKLSVLWPFVKRIVTICHKHIVTSFDYSAKAQINLSDGIKLFVYIY